MTLFTWVWRVMHTYTLTIINRTAATRPQCICLKITIQRYRCIQLVGTYMSNQMFTCFAFINFTTDRLIGFFSTIAVTSSAAGVRYCICEYTCIIVRTKFKDTNTCDTIFIPLRSASRFIDLFNARQRTRAIRATNFAGRTTIPFTTDLVGTTFCVIV